ncbi:MAG: ATP-grasp domain-containing protein [Candidatus Zixiibacteriota bacterium]
MIKKTNWRVLVTDADALHSLAIVRSLGRKGMRVSMSSHRRIFSLCFYSKFCKERIIYPAPNRSKEFIDFMLDQVRSNKFDILLPVRSTVTPLIAEHAERFRPFVNFVLPSFESMTIANNKELTFRFAEKVGVPAPKTIYPRKFSDIEQEVRKFRFPVVTKVLVASGSRGLAYLNSPDELLRFAEKNFAQESNLTQKRWIVQEYIRGSGCGFFSIFDRGEPKAIFMHRRIREYPITGGPSTVAESFYHPRLKELGLKLLKTLNWNGVAMVEFKWDKEDNEFKLMEINPRFWGSLNLPVACGVDFPYLFCLLSMKQDFKPVFKYEEGIKFRWLFPGDFMHLLAQYGLSKDFYMDFFDPRVRYDISLSDIKPNIVELFLIAGYFIQNRGKIRYPQGKPARPAQAP